MLLQPSLEPIEIAQARVVVLDFEFPVLHWKGRVALPVIPVLDLLPVKYWGYPGQ